MQNNGWTNGPKHMEIPLGLYSSTANGEKSEKKNLAGDLK